MPKLSNREQAKILREKAQGKAVVLKDDEAKSSKSKAKQKQEQKQEQE